MYLLSVRVSVENVSRLTHAAASVVAGHQDVRDVPVFCWRNSCILPDCFIRNLQVKAANTLDYSFSNQRVGVRSDLY